jgi:hypothetical protein
MRRYVQSHIVGERTSLDIPTTNVEIDRIAELWYATGTRWNVPTHHRKPGACTPMPRCSLVSIKSFIVEEKVIVPEKEK